MDAELDAFFNANQPAIAPELQGLINEIERQEQAQARQQAIDRGEGIYFYDGRYYVITPPQTREPSPTR